MSLRGILVEDWGKPGEHTLPIPLHNNSPGEDKRQGAGLLGRPSSFGVLG